TRMTFLLVGQLSQPVLHVDWSDLDTFKGLFLIRASLATQGRSLTLYEQVHCLKTKEKPETHRVFMNNLKSMRPEACKPIIVTDAGFKTPWFKLIERLGWDYVGRCRSNTHCLKSGTDTWLPIKRLYGLATSNAKNLGKYLLAKSVGHSTRLVVYWRKAKGRKDKTVSGDRERKSSQSRSCAEREKEPWLLATSLTQAARNAKQVTTIYGTRMQIKESFRDLKSGLNMNHSGTRNQKRFKVLLL
ncbi:IS4 family transposase, partial [Pseudoalteromonas luteoviolacea]